jgi:hypothetical protein
MATTVTRFIENGIRNAVIHFTGDFDSATDLTNFKPFTLAAFAAYPNLGSPTKFAIEQMTFRTFGVAVTLYWEGTANEIVAVFQPEYTDSVNMKSTGGLPNNVAGATGELLLSTLNASAGAKYDILLQIRKVYGNAS